MDENWIENEPTASLRDHLAFLEGSHALGDGDHSAEIADVETELRLRND